MLETYAEQGDSPLAPFSLPLPTEFVRTSQDGQSRTEKDKRITTRD